MSALYTALHRVAPSEVDSLRNTELESAPETSIWLRGIGDLELVELWELLPGAQSEGTLMADVLDSPDAEIVLIAVPQNFLDCVRNLPESQILSIMEQWHEIDELSGRTHGQLAAAFADLRQLALAAHDAGQLVVQTAEI